MIDGGLRKLFKAKLPGHFQSIETGGTGLGVPDTNFCIDGVEGWIEYKRTSANAVRVRPEQVAWIERRVRAGGRVFVAVRRSAKAGPRRSACDELWLLRPAAARLLATGAGLASLPHGMVLERSTGGPAGWDWALIGALLVE